MVQSEAGYHRAAISSIFGSDVPFGNVGTIVRRLPEGISVKWQDITEGRSLGEGVFCLKSRRLEVEWTAPIWICGLP